MRSELLGDDPGVEAALGGSDLEAVILVEDIGEELRVLLIGVHEQDPGAGALEAIEGHAVGLHEPDQLGHRDPSILAAGDAIASELTAVEPFGNGSGGYVTDSRDFAGGEDVFSFAHCFIFSWVVQAYFSQFSHFFCDTFLIEDDLGLGLPRCYLATEDESAIQWSELSN